MKALAEIQVVPLGAGVSVRKEVMRAHAIIKDSGLVVQLHSYGTNVEGELGLIFETIEKVHETLHAEGTVRLMTSMKIGTRTDKDASLAGKLFKT
jgi:uncharacterized protein (TIGR00106 family)